ncbi:NAD-dependent epimerase/dehydratase family protein [Acidisoma silvae]|uniref:NAD(P)-dependent oxidoreductase n=1 Tax=Acidisoma silvae TaxID=2802396 RepID=A0A963YW37_9PROT|nr:NAD(P)-dependent oxidoreductase [Acidisoma silvae]MCB8878209.1 NAD(P)-dependent oxidoreductase [Acidisoma silvae]
MTVLITGATGFAMSVLARTWAEFSPDERVVVLDAAKPDTAAMRYFAPVADRLRVIVGDITVPESWAPQLESFGITHIVHGATVTPLARGTAADIGREPEAAEPARIIAVNTMGTVALLEWARAQPGIQRFIYVSSGAVYRHHGPDRPGEPLPEDGYVAPRRLYGISKLSSELIAERYGELFGLSVASVRMSSVYGTMDRVTASRDFRHIPNRIAHKALARSGALRVNTLEAVGDYIHAEDAARAIHALAKADILRYGVYNVAAGETATIGQLVEWAAEKVAGFTAETVPESEAEMIENASLTGGMWGAYDIARITQETGWRPRPTREAFHAYIDWLAEGMDA